MIAACPSCNSRYRVDPDRIPSRGARLRCARCQALFPVAAPAPTGVDRKPAADGGGFANEAVGEGAALVLIADSDAQRGEATAAALAQWGLTPVLVNDGVETILTIQRALPRAVVLDTSLPRMNGSQICELMKRNAVLSEIAVILVGTADGAEFAAPPPGFAADACLAPRELPDALRPLLREAGLPVAEPRSTVPRKTGTTRATGSGDSPRMAPDLGSRPPVATAGPTKPAEPSEAERAERLARIIISDVVLYSPEKFAAAVASSDVVEAMEGEMREGRKLFAQRVGAETRARRDFLGDELRRVAADRIAG